jgi:hypothetical protein
LAGRRLRARHACGRHGNLRLSAGDTYANANRDAHSYADSDTDGYTDGYTTASHAQAAANTASSADAVG